MAGHERTSTTTPPCYLAGPSAGASGGDARVPSTHGDRSPARRGFSGMSEAPAQASPLQVTLNDPATLGCTVQ